VLRWLQAATPLLGMGKGAWRNRPAGQPGPNRDDVLEKLANGHAQQKDWITSHSLPGTAQEWSTALCIPIIDPARQPPNDAPIMEQIRSQIDNFLTDEISQGATRDPSAEAEEWSRRPPRNQQDGAHELRRKLRENVFRGWVFAQPSGLQVISQDVAGADDF